MSHSEHVGQYGTPLFRAFSQQFSIFIFDIHNRVCTYLDFGIMFSGDRHTPSLLPPNTIFALHIGRNRVGDGRRWMEIGRDDQVVLTEVSWDILHALILLLETRGFQSAHRKNTRVHATRQQSRESVLHENMLTEREREEVAKSFFSLCIQYEEVVSTSKAICQASRS